MSSSKPKAKSSVNEQVKAGIAALKDFLGGHAEPTEDRNPTTDDREPAKDDPGGTTEHGLPTSDDAGHASDDESASEDELRDAVRINSQPEDAKSDTDNSDQEHKGQLETEKGNQIEPRSVNTEAQPISAKDNPDSKASDAAPESNSQASEESISTGEPAAGQESIDRASFEDAVETLRAAGPSAGRVAAARTIAELGSQRATPHLIAAMFDDDPDVRSAAEEALARIGEPTFKQTTTPQTEIEKSTMMQPPLNAPQPTSVTPPSKGIVGQPPPKETTRAEPQPVTEQRQERAEVVVHAKVTDKPIGTGTATTPVSETSQPKQKTDQPAEQTTVKPHKLKAVPTKAEVKLDPDASEEEQQLLIEERAVRQRLELIVQQLSEKVAARKETENEVHWRLERESKLLADAAAQRAKEEQARKKVEEEAAQRRKQEAEAIAAEHAARAKADAEAERLANAEVRLRNEVAKLSRTAEEMEQRRKEVETTRRNAAAAARQAEALRARDEADRMHKTELERLRNEQAMLQTSTEKAASRRAEVDAARERAEKDAAALAQAQARMRDAEDARTKAEAERVKLEAELHLKVETEEALLAAARQRAQDEQARLVEEARRHREAEEKRLSDFEESKRKAEFEAKQRAEREQQIRSQLDTLRIADADVRKRIEEAEVRRKAAEEAFRLVAEKVQRVEAEAHASKLEEEQILAKLEAARRNAAVEAQGRAEQEKRIKDEIEMFRRLEDEERPRLEELILQRSDAETRLQQARERFKSEEEARVRAEEQSESLREYRRHAIEPQVISQPDDTVEIIEPPSAARVATPAPVHFAEGGSAQEEIVDAEVPAAAEIPAAISSYLHSVDPYKRAAAVAELARSQAKDAFALIARCFDDHSPHVRNAAARALRKLEPQKSVDLFNRALEEGSSERRKNIGSAIAASGLASEAIDNLVSENREETYNALSILFVMAKTGEVQPLVQAIEEHGNEEVCRAVLKLLTLSGQSELGDAALQRRVMGVAASRQKAAERHDEIPEFRLRIAEVEVKRALGVKSEDVKKSDE